MSTPHSIERQGTAALREQLTAAGRHVAESDRKTFDLIVDGVYAEVKCKAKPYREFDFIGLTQNQYKALESGPAFRLFIVCNVRDPNAVEVFEIDSQQLRRSPPKVESTYYWHKRQIDGLLT